MIMSFSSNIVVCDKQRHGIVYLVGRPRDPGWKEVIEDAADAVENRRPSMQFNARPCRRGVDAEAIGFSHGGGQVCVCLVLYSLLNFPQVRPSNTKHRPSNITVMNELVQHPSMIRISGVANSAFKRFCPAMYEEYRENLSVLREWDPELRLNFDKSVFACWTVNFGPQTITRPHRDFLNYGPGFCAVTSLGNFNDKLGGHIVLWELGLVIRFPAGCTILLPSAMITHSNLPIQPGETRYSVTQYSAGALFRFASNGFQNDKEVLASLDDNAKRLREAVQQTRLNEAFSKYCLW
jgi:hypothetical protein